MEEQGGKIVDIDAMPSAPPVRMAVCRRFRIVAVALIDSAGQTTVRCRDLHHAPPGESWNDYGRRFLVELVRQFQPTSLVVEARGDLLDMTRWLDLPATLMSLDQAKAVLLGEDNDGRHATLFSWLLDAHPGLKRHMSFDLTKGTLLLDRRWKTVRLIALAFAKAAANPPTGDYS